MLPTLIAVGIQVIIFSVALTGSFVVFKFLKGTAQIKRKEIQLGGAAAFFVVMYILINHYAFKTREYLASDFDLIESAYASQPITRIDSNGLKETIEVTLSPSTQLVTYRDFKKLNRNKFFIDDKLRIAIKKPPEQDWSITRSKELNVIGIIDIPAWKMFFTNMHSKLKEHQPEIFSIVHYPVHNIILNCDSKIEKIPMDFNVYDIPGMIEALEDQIHEVLKDEPEIKDKFKKAHSRIEKLVEQFQKSINSKLPIKKKINNALHIIFLNKEFLNNSLVNKMFPERNILDAALNCLFTSEYASFGTVSNSYVNHNRNLISFNGSVKLTDIIMDGKKRDLLINNVTFITSVGEKVAFVQLVYLSSDPVKIFQVLKETLDSLHIAL